LEPKLNVLHDLQLTAEQSPAVWKYGSPLTVPNCML